jgi:RNA polymerase sigma-70 factor (ECF subfamily)
VADRNGIKRLRAPPDVTERAFAEFGAKLNRFLHRRLRSGHDARDLAQETYLRFMQVSRQEEIRNPQALLYRLAANLVHEFRVRERYSRVVYDSEHAEVHEGAVAEDLSVDPADQMNLSREFQRVLEELPKPLQAVLLLRKCAGFSPEEIARELGLTKGTVYAYLIRAVAHFKAAQFDR